MHIELGVKEKVIRREPGGNMREARLDVIKIIRGVKTDGRIMDRPTVQ